MKKVLSIIVMLVIFASVLTCNAEDLQQDFTSDWATDYIIKAENIGLTDSVSGLIYKDNITREKFCELIYDFIMITQKHIITPEHKNHFVDTDNEKIVVLNAAEIIYGKSSTEFVPNDLLTREEAATIIVRMLNSVMPMPTAIMYFEYIDNNDISEWASSSIQVMSNFGFMIGVGDNKFAPKDNYTVEQSITTLVRIYETLKKSYEYITPLGTVTSETDYNGHINFGIEANVRIVFIKDKTQFVLSGPFKAFTNETTSMYITFDDFAKIFNGKWELNNNSFEFNYDASINITLTDYTPNEMTNGNEWPNKTGVTPVLFFTDIRLVLINGEEKVIKGQYGGKVYDSNIMMYNNELYIPVQMVAELLGYDIATTNIIWN